MKKKVFILFIIIILLIPAFVQSRTGKGKEKLYVNPQRLQESEKQMIHMVNVERTKMGLKKLIPDPGLKKTALKHNRKMAEMRKLSHTFKDYPRLSGRLVQENIFFESAGENIAFGSFYLPDYFHDGFMKSRQHRENILDKKFTHCGISIIETVKGFYVTQEFANLIDLKKRTEIKKKFINFIKKELKKRNSGKTVYLKEIEPFCRNYLSKLMGGEKIKNLPSQLSGFGMIEIASPKLKNIEDFIIVTVKKNSFTNFSISIDFLRSEKSPGGTYVFVMIYKLGNRYIISTGDIKKNLLKKINRFLNGLGMSSVLIEKRLSSYANKINKKYLKRSSSIPRYRDIIFTAYQTNAPDIIPQRLGSILRSRNIRGRLGMSIIRKGNDNSGDNIYFICITWRM